MKNIKRSDLDQIQQQVIKDSTPSPDGDAVRVTVHMGTCGIAAGGQSVLDALNDEIAKVGRKDIRVVISACMGLCSSEPNVTVWRAGEDPVIYQGLTGEKMRQIFQTHILGGELVSDYALVQMRQTQ
jgi:NADP-reducing hydrogenase subunit HndB